MVTERDSAGALLRDILNVESGVRRSLGGPAGGGGLLSPDGAWVLWRGSLRQSTTSRWYAFPVDRPEALRAVGDERQGESQMIWAATGSPRRYLADLRIDAPAGPIPLRAGYRMRARGLDAAEQSVPVRALVWRSGDTTIATVDASGLLRPRRAGRVTIHATAGGWRTDSLQIEVGSVAPETVLNESWRGGLTAEWVPYGDPLPTIVRLPDSSAAFWSRGDSSFDSGVYSRRALAARAGLGVEATVSGRISSPQWQRHVVTLDASLDGAWLVGWDHRTGGAEGSPGPGKAHCSAYFPSQEGAAGLRHLAFGCDSAIEVPAPSGLRDGSWHVLRLQLLPDGRLGFAVDGRPVGLTTTQASLAVPFRIVLSGQSHGARMLVREVTAWTGVRDDIDWRVIEKLPSR